MKKLKFFVIFSYSLGQCGFFRVLAHFEMSKDRYGVLIPQSRFELRRSFMKTWFWVRSLLVGEIE